jgi:hypothetical protein
VLWVGERRGITGILVAAAACLLIAGIAVHARLAVIDEAAFASRATSTLRSDEVRLEVAARTGRRVVAERPEMAPGEAVVEDAIAQGVALDPAFQAGFRTAAARMHHALFWDPDAEASLRIAGSGAALRADLRNRVPEVAGQLPRIGDPALLSVGSTGPERALRRVAPWARTLTGPLAVGFGVLGLGLLGLAIARAGDRRRAVWGSGLAVAAAGGLIAAGVTAARDLVLERFDTSYGDAVVSVVWNAFLGDLRIWALAACAAGLVVAAAAGGPRLAPRALLAVPRTRGTRLLRAVGLLAVAGLAVQVPQLVLHLALVAVAAAATYVAAGDLLRVFAPPHGAARHARAAAVAAALLALIAVVAVA